MFIKPCEDYLLHGILTQGDPNYFVPALVIVGAMLGHVSLSGRKLGGVGPVQYLMHKIYAVMEPPILRITDFLVSSSFIKGNGFGRALMRLIATASHYLPHGIVITTDAAGRFLEYIEKLEGPERARIAVGPCVCQRAIGKWEEPTIKDIVILYGADIYTHLKLGYILITAREAKKILVKSRDAGLIHSIEFCMQSGRWTFVICNCDRKICVVTRTYFLTGKMIYPGPQIVSSNGARCRGEKKCGKCIPVCMFGAISSTGKRPVTDYDQCMGCGLCVHACGGTARSMKNRAGYAHDALIPADILTGRSRA